MNRVVITGATGTIGMALINKCIESKIEVIALVNPDSRRLDRIPKDPLVRVIKCGLDDLAEASAKLLKLGIVPHLVSSTVVTFSTATLNEIVAI